MSTPQTNTSADATSYDEVPYPCFAYQHTHPEHLSAIAALHGLKAAPAHACRVLEIGCGSGGNILPMAGHFPGSQFMGLDLAATSIAEAEAETRRTGLTNIKWAAMDLTQLRADPGGPWDYIIAHGVFSWVPEPVRIGLLDLCRNLLSPEGIAFISYNAYPGCHIRQMLRGMLLYHTDGASDVKTKTGQGRALLQLLSDGQDADDDYGVLLKSEVDRVMGFNPHHFYHDDLADINQPYYVHEFASLAAARGLQYLSDADYSSTCDHHLPPSVRATLSGLDDDPIRKQQYLDFMACRRFRQTLLCHAGREVLRQPPDAAWESLYFASSARAGEDSCLTDGSTVEFKGDSSLHIKTAHPASKRCLAALGSVWPARLSWAGLLEKCGVSSEKLRPAVLEMIALRAVSLHGSAELYASTLPERPCVSALARNQIQHSRTVTTLRHHTVHIEDDMGCWLLSLLDGTRTRADLATALTGRIRTQAGAAIDMEKEIAEALTHIDTGMDSLLRMGLIEKPQS